MLGLDVEMLNMGISKNPSKDKAALNNSIQNRIRKTALVLHLFRASVNPVHLSDSFISKRKLERFTTPQIFI
jgi:hypothetical protein